MLPAPRPGFGGPPSPPCPPPTISVRSSPCQPRPPTGAGRITRGCSGQSRACLWALRARKRAPAAEPLVRPLTNMNITVQSRQQPTPVRLVSGILAAAAGTALLFLVPSFTFWAWLLVVAVYLVSPFRTKTPHEITPRDIWLFLAALALVLVLVSLYWHWHPIPYSPPPDQIQPLTPWLRYSLWCVWLLIFAPRVYRGFRRQSPSLA